MNTNIRLPMDVWCFHPNVFLEDRETGGWRITTFGSNSSMLWIEGSLVGYLSGVQKVIKFRVWITNSLLVC